MRHDVIVIGGGLIGLATAWRAAGAGFDVAVVDDAPGGGASHVAAGMLAPVTEVTYGEEALLRLAIASSGRWPAFVDDLEAAAGTNVGYRADGTLLVAHDGDDRRVLEDLCRFMGELGLAAESLNSRACRRREPMLSPRVRGGVLAHDDHQVDPRRTLAALRRASTAAGVTHVPARAARIDHGRGRVRGVTLSDGTAIEAPQVVLAAGVASADVDGLPDHERPPVRPVKGQILRVRGSAAHPLLGAAVRGIVHGRSIYLVPRSDGEVVVGATQEERGFETTVTAGGVRELLDDAARIVPGVDELELTETIAGLRPGTHDNRPLIGRAGIDGLLLATGHHRNGVLLTPITAEAIVDLMTDATPDPVVAVADPGRPGARPAARPRPRSDAHGEAS